MIDLIPARPEMAERLTLHQGQAATGQFMTETSVAVAIQRGMALAAFEGETLLGMAGLCERFEGCALAWALLGEDFAPHKLSIFKLMKRALDATPFARVEAYVVEGHEEGLALLRHLGFVEEGIMRKLWQGRDHHLLARVR